MSTTAIDMAKVTQMLDAGWQVRIYKGGMDSYEVRAFHPLKSRMNATRRALAKTMREKSTLDFNALGMTPEEASNDWNFHDGEVMTDDFTPEQALTRMAYKVFGEII